MKALINTFNEIPGVSIGTVISLHRTTEAARKADDKFQRAVKRKNGDPSYIPTRIVEIVGGTYSFGFHVHPRHAKPVDLEY